MPALPSPQIEVEVTLQCLDPNDKIPLRRFFLSRHQVMRVGRSSKSHQKAILPESRNAYIESQVVSRNHAVFSLGKSDDDNAVYLTDTGSMHGTKVNNIKLDPNQPHRLCSNDKLSFGGEVQRGMDTFYPKAYQFTYRTFDKDPLFPRGVSVPSEEDSDTAYGPCFKAADQQSAVPNREAMTEIPTPPREEQSSAIKPPSFHSLYPSYSQYSPTSPTLFGLHSKADSRGYMVPPPKTFLPASSPNESKESAGDRCERPSGEADASSADDYGSDDSRSSNGLELEEHAGDFDPLCDLDSHSEELDYHEDDMSDLDEGITNRNADTDLEDENEDNDGQDDDYGNRSEQDRLPTQESSKSGLFLQERPARIPEPNKEFFGYSEHSPPAPSPIITPPPASDNSVPSAPTNLPATWRFGGYSLQQHTPLFLQQLNTDHLRAPVTRSEFPSHHWTAGCMTTPKPSAIQPTHGLPSELPPFGYEFNKLTPALFDEVEAQTKVPFCGTTSAPTKTKASFREAAAGEVPSIGGVFAHVLPQASSNAEKSGPSQQRLSMKKGLSIKDMIEHRPEGTSPSFSFVASGEKSEAATPSPSSAIDNVRTRATPPPVPSGLSGMKRKADVLDDESHEAILDVPARGAAEPTTDAAPEHTIKVHVRPAHSTGSTNSAGESPGTAVESDATEASSPVAPRVILRNDAEQPPRKRLRRALNFAGTVGMSFAIGAIAMVGGLTALPDGFFE